MDAVLYLFIKSPFLLLYVFLKLFIVLSLMLILFVLFFGADGFEVSLLILLFVVVLKSSFLFLSLFNSLIPILLYKKLIN